MYPCWHLPRRRRACQRLGNMLCQQAERLPVRNGANLISRPTQRRPRRLAAEASSWASWRPKATASSRPLPQGSTFQVWRPSLLARLREVHRGEVTARLHRLPHLGQPTPDSGQGMGVEGGGGGGGGHFLQGAAKARPLPRRGRCQGELTEAAQAGCMPRIPTPLCLRGVREGCGHQASMPTRGAPLPTRSRASTRRA